MPERAVPQIEFKPWPKTPRLNRDMVVTEKIDGTNSAIHIIEAPLGTYMDGVPEGATFVLGPNMSDSGMPEVEFLVAAQSRNRLIRPGKTTDNYGFAGWVARNAEALVATLGAGVHYGEWWGAGIARKYGLTGDDKRFSLFNVNRYSGIDFAAALPNVATVPVLYEGPFDSDVVNQMVQFLRLEGSRAVPGYMKPEGVIAFHTASQSVFKVTLEKDEAPKSKEAINA